MKQATIIQTGNVFQPAIADERGTVMPLEARGRPIYYKTAEAARDHAARILADAQHARATALFGLTALFTACSVILCLQGASPLAILSCGVFSVVAADFVVAWRRAALSLRA